MYNLIGGREQDTIGSWSILMGSALTQRLTYLQKKVDEFWSVHLKEVLL